MQHDCCASECTNAVCIWGSSWAVLTGHMCVVCVHLPHAGEEIHQGVMALAHKAVMLLLMHLPAPLCLFQDGFVWKK